MSNSDNTRRTVVFHGGAPARGERASARWQAQLVLVFVGLPGLALTLLTLVSAGAGRWPLLGIAAALLNSGLPIVIVSAARTAPEMVEAVFVFWVACFFGCVVAARGDAGAAEVPDDMLLAISAGTSGTAATAAITAIGAAACMATCAHLVARLLASEGRAALAQPAPDVAAPAPLPPAPMAGVEPATGWRMWFERCVSPSKGGEVTAADAYAHYRLWAASNGINGIVPKVTFGQLITRSLESLGAQPGHSNGRVYRGITLAELGAGGVAVADPGEAE
jgi:hypothetical protein